MRRIAKAKDKNGETPVYEANEFGKQEAVDVLIRKEQPAGAQDQ
jgi:ankyrin repeat protein